ncbi:hypothetical protein INR49_026487 [Caranx melampygus]|nr:hypothetical protein INR49_026487 [Caranx melampygus]
MRETMKQKPVRKHRHQPPPPSRFPSAEKWLSIQNKAHCTSGQRQPGRKSSVSRGNRKQRPLLLGRSLRVSCNEQMSVVCPRPRSPDTDSNRFLGCVSVSLHLLPLLR